jgi:hypothetical protein
MPARRASRVRPGPAPTPMAGVPRPAPQPIGRPITQPACPGPSAGPARGRPAAAAAARRWHRSGGARPGMPLVTQSGFARPAAPMTPGGFPRAPAPRPLPPVPAAPAAPCGARAGPVRPLGPRQHPGPGLPGGAADRPPAAAEEMSLDLGTTRRRRRRRRGPAPGSPGEGLARGHREDCLGSRPPARRRPSCEKSPSGRCASGTGKG